MSAIWPPNAGGMTFASLRSQDAVTAQVYPSIDPGTDQSTDLYLSAAGNVTLKNLSVRLRTGHFYGNSPNWLYNAGDEFIRVDDYGNTFFGPNVWCSLDADGKVVGRKQDGTPGGVLFQSDQFIDVHSSSTHLGRHAEMGHTNDPIDFIIERGDTAKPEVLSDNVIGIPANPYKIGWNPVDLPVVSLGTSAALTAVGTSGEAHISRQTTPLDPSNLFESQQAANKLTWSGTSFGTPHKMLGVQGMRFRVRTAVTLTTSVDQDIDVDFVATTNVTKSQLIKNGDSTVIQSRSISAPVVAGVKVKRFSFCRAKTGTVSLAPGDYIFFYCEFVGNRTVPSVHAGDKVVIEADPYPKLPAPGQKASFWVDGSDGLGLGRFYWRTPVIPNGGMHGLDAATGWSKPLAAIGGTARGPQQTVTGQGGGIYVSTNPYGTSANLIRATWEPLGQLRVNAGLCIGNWVELAKGSPLQTGSVPDLGGAGSYALTNVPMFTSLDVGLTGPAPLITITELTVGGPAQNEQQRVKLTGVTGGSFQLRFNGFSSGTIAYDPDLTTGHNADAAQAVVDALLAMVDSDGNPVFGAGDVSVTRAITGAANDTQYDITFGSIVTSSNSLFTVTNTAPQTINNFTAGGETMMQGQLLVLRFRDGNTTLAHNHSGAAKMWLQGEANVTPRANQVVAFVWDANASAFYQVGGSPPLGTLTPAGPTAQALTVSYPVTQTATPVRIYYDNTLAGAQDEMFRVIPPLALHGTLQADGSAAYGNDSLVGVVAFGPSTANDFTGAGDIRQWVGDGNVQMSLARRGANKGANGGTLVANRFRAAMVNNPGQVYVGRANARDNTDAEINDRAWTGLDLGGNVYSEATGRFACLFWPTVWDTNTTIIPPGRPTVVGGVSRGGFLQWNFTIKTEMAENPVTLGKNGTAAGTTIGGSHAGINNLPCGLDINTRDNLNDHLRLWSKGELDVSAGPVRVGMQSPDQPTAAVVAGGTLATGFYIYQVVPIDVAGIPGNPTGFATWNKTPDGTTHANMTLLPYVDAATGNRSVTLTWTQTLDATKYEVWRGFVDFTTGAVTHHWSLDVGNVGTFTDTGYVATNVVGGKTVTAQTLYPRSTSQTVVGHVHSSIYSDRIRLGVRSGAAGGVALRYTGDGTTTTGQFDGDLNVAGALSTTAVSAAEFGRLAGVTSPVQTQLNTEAAARAAADALLAPLASPALTGTPTTAESIATDDSDTTIANTAYVRAQKSRDELRNTGLGYVAQACDEMLLTGGALTATGAVYWIAVGLRKGDPISNILVIPTVNGTGMTNTQVGVATASGATMTVRAVSADVTSLLTSGAANRRQALPVSYTAPADGLYYLFFLSVGGTQPTLARLNAVSSAALPNGTLRFGQTTGQTTLAVSDTKTNAPGTYGLWMAAT